MLQLVRVHENFGRLVYVNCSGEHILEHIYSLYCHGVLVAEDESEEVNGSCG